VTAAADGVTAPAPAVDGRALRRQRNAERLYDAADELLATRSYEELTIEEICQRAKVGRATFFRIYDTKAGLLREFNRRLAADAAERIRAAGSADIRTELGHVRDAIVDAWRHAGPGQLGMAREFARSMPTADLHAAHPELLALVVERISIAVDAGELPAAVPADLAASLALIHMTAPVACAIAGRDVDFDQLSRVLLGQWFTGMSEA
jgi:AcrR family transcriptional regulator